MGGIPLLTLEPDSVGYSLPREGASTRKSVLKVPTCRKLSVGTSRYWRKMLNLLKFVREAPMIRNTKYRPEGFRSTCVRDRTNCTRGEMLACVH